MLFRRSRRRAQEREEATANRMRGLMATQSYEWADPADVEEQVRSRTDALSRSAREDQEAKSAR